MEQAIKDLSLEELKQILKLAQKEIDRRTIKRVEISQQQEIVGPFPRICPLGLPWSSLLGRGVILH